MIKFDVKMTGKLDADSVKLPLVCPNCSKKFAETLGRLKSAKKVTCPGCRREIAVNLK